MKAAAYIRVSTEDQATQGYSLDEQARMVREAADLRGWELVRIYREAGVSGRRDDRPELSRMLAELADFDRVIVPAIDRLGRGSRHLLAVYDAFESAGVGLVSLRESFDTSTPAGRFVRLILSGQAEMESENIGERVRASIAARARQGRAKGGPRPFGYRYEDGLLVIVETEAEIVRRIFADAIAGKSQLGTARDLTRDGIPTVRGGRWQNCSVAAILRNPVYKGVVTHRGEEFPGVHEPIVDAETWAKAEAIRTSRRRTYGRGRPPAGGHLFRKGMLRCGECGEAMAPRTNPNRTGEPTETYRCLGRHHDKDSCSMKPVRRESIDDAVYRYFEQVALDVDATRQAITEARDRKLAEARALRRDAEVEAQRAEGRLARVRRDYSDGAITAAEWRGFRDELEGERRAAHAEAERLISREQQIVMDSDLRDAESETLRYLAEVRAAVAGEVKDSDRVEAVRATLGRLFDCFVLHRGTPQRAHVELIGQMWIEPVPRGRPGELRPPEKASLGGGTLDNEKEMTARQAEATIDLTPVFGPIVVAA